jgi:arylsulfatase A
MKGREIVGGKASLPDAGTHVSLVANWPDQIKAGRRVNELVDFTDFLPTLVEAAGASVPTEIKTDGQSFLPVLRGQPYKARDWIFCHYIRNGVKMKPTNPKQAQSVLMKQKLAKEKKLMGRFARNQNYKLYEDGRFYDVSKDVLEQHPLPPKADTRGLAKIRTMLQQVHDSMPAWKAFQ